MSKVIRSFLIIAAVVIGLVTITLVVLKLLGIDCPICKGDDDCCEPKKTKIKRNYTELILPDEA